MNIKKSYYLLSIRFVYVVTFFWNDITDFRITGKIRWKKNMIWNSTLTWNNILALTQNCRDPLNLSWAHCHGEGYPGTKCLPKSHIYKKEKYVETKIWKSSIAMAYQVMTYFLDRIKRYKNLHDMFLDFNEQLFHWKNIFWHIERSYRD